MFGSIWFVASFTVTGVRVKRRPTVRTVHGLGLDDLESLHRHQAEMERLFSDCIDDVPGISDVTGLIDHS